MPTGEVTFFHDEKGYGFLETAEADDDVFFHMDDIDGPEPREGDEFAFEIEDGPRGLRAKELELLEDADEAGGF